MTPATFVASMSDLNPQIKITSEYAVACGGYSDVYTGELMENSHGTLSVRSCKVAVKVLRALTNYHYDIHRARKRLNREVKVWGSISHRNIARFRGVSSQIGGRPAIVTDWYLHGDAPTYLRQRPETNKLVLIRDVTRGLKYLHTLNPPIVHGDLKGNNVLIDHDGHAVIADFGLSRMIEEIAGPSGNTTSTLGHGAAAWQAPELTSSDEGIRPTMASDVWALGCTVYELLTGNTPYHHIQKKPFQIRKVIMDGITPVTIPDLLCHGPYELWRIMSSCWVHRPEGRPDIVKVEDQLLSSVASFYSIDRQKLRTAISSYIEKSQTQHAFDRPPVPSVYDLGSRVRNLSQFPIAGGGFSDTYCGELEVSENNSNQTIVKTVAVKTMRPFVNSGVPASDTRKRLARELDVLGILNHPNIAHFYGVTFGIGGRPSIIMDWYAKGDAPRYLSTRSEAEKIRLIYDIARGLRYLHGRSPPVVHGDLKGNNILVDNDGHAVLSDFGLSRILVGGPKGTTTLNAASVRWQAPQVFSAEEDDLQTVRTPTSDVWSFACTAYELLTGHVPYSHIRREWKVIERVLSGGTPAMEEDFVSHDSPEIWAILSDCWQYQDEDRPVATELVPRLEVCLS